MIVNIGTYQRKTFQVRAMRVTKSNMREIASWVGGTVVEGRAPHILVSCGDKKENRKAFVGSWITNLINDEAPDELNLRVYDNHTFLQAFQQIMDEADKYARVHELLMLVRNAQDHATFNGETSEGVMLLIDQAAREICSFV